MKKNIITMLLGMSCAATAMAEGYQVNTLSTRQMGMAHTGAGMHLGAESMYFNPAGMATMEGTMDLTGSFTTIFAKAHATLPDGDRYSTANDPSTPIMVNAAFSIYPCFKAGISFYTPYGSGIDWTDNWPGSVLNQRVNLKMFTIQPTIALRVTKKLSVGLGATINWGSVNLSKGLVVPGTADIMLGILEQIGQIQDPVPYNGIMPASVSLNGKSNVAMGFNVGVMYDITPQLTVGTSWRSRVKLNVEAGDAAVKYANTQAMGVLNELNIINSTNFTASMPGPYVWSIGASYRPTARWEVAVDWRLTGWKTYKQLDVEFLDELCAAYNQHITKDYRNAWALSAGGRFTVTERLKVAAGLMIDTTPVNSNYYNPETPGMTKIEPTVGLSFSPLKGFNIDLSAMYVAGLGRDNASYQYPDLLAVKLNGMAPALNLPVIKTFTADYKASAFIASLGLRYSF